MRQHIIEATNNEQNWGKFMLQAYDADDLAYRSIVMPTVRLLAHIGDYPLALWVMDLQTGEGARFYPKPGGIASEDLGKHKIWVCPLFEPFLGWLYENRITGLYDFSLLPSIVQLPHAPFALSGRRREGE